MGDSISVCDHGVDAKLYCGQCYIAQLEQRLDEANESALNAYGEGIKDCETRIKQEGMVRVDEINLTRVIALANSGSSAFKPEYYVSLEAVCEAVKEAQQQGEQDE